VRVERGAKWRVWIGAELVGVRGSERINRSREERLKRDLLTEGRREADRCPNVDWDKF
jgi:hypothetical protein